MPRSASRSRSARLAVGPKTASGSTSGVMIVSSMPVRCRSAIQDAVSSASSYAGSVQLTPTGAAKATRERSPRSSCASSSRNDTTSAAPVNGSAPGSHAHRRAPTATIRMSYDSVAERLRAIRLLSGSTASSDATCSCAPCSAATAARSNRRVCARPNGSATASGWYTKRRLGAIRSTCGGDPEKRAQPQQRLDRGDPATTDHDTRPSRHAVQRCFGAAVIRNSVRSHAPRPRGG